MTKNILQLIFSGASLWRWNDKLRPVALVEIEKQAHKMLVACALWRQASLHLTARDSAELATSIIEGALFDYFYRLIITDIKPPVFYKIRQHREQYEQLTGYVLAQLKPPLIAAYPAFWQRLAAWHLKESHDLAHRILAAAHLFASHWEFQLIRPHNPFDEEMDGIAAVFASELAEYADLPSMAALLDPQNALGRFANLCGQLRFQIRWTQVSRIPATSVLGHMFIVAASAYMYSLKAEISQTRACNNFFGGLFHDFPEVLTRDIISPVKKSIPGLSRLIHEYEISELERRVLGPLRQDGFGEFVERIGWYLGLEAGSEFQDCCRIDNKLVNAQNFAELTALESRHEPYGLDARDGQLLKSCDLLAAFLEAENSIANGIVSPQLVEGRQRLKQELCVSAPDFMQLQDLLHEYET